MSTSASFLRAIRLTHLYVGVFAAPAILFFAFTGAIQTFSLHETTKGSDYKPPRILVILGQIHKKQTPIVGAPKAPAAPKPEKHSDHAGPGDDSARAQNPSDPSGKKPDGPAAIAPATPPPAPKHNPLPLKIFFLLIALSLFTSTLTGIYMSYKYARNKVAVTLLLILGVVIPVAMILI